MPSATTSPNNWFAMVIFAAAALVAFKWKVNSAWVLTGGGIAGLGTPMTP